MIKVDRRRQGAHRRSKNELPQSTSVHLHGIEVPERDGRRARTSPRTRSSPARPSPTTSPPQGPAVGMYHSHDYAAQPGARRHGRRLHHRRRAAARRATARSPRSSRWCSTTPASSASRSTASRSRRPRRSIANAGETVEIHYINEGQQIHPMHLHGIPQLVIAKDGFPLPKPYQADTVDGRAGRALHGARASRPPPRRACGRSTATS